MNKIILTGRLTKDSQLNFLPNTGTPKVNFTLAVERAFQKDKNNKVVDFINCEMLGKHTENICQYLTKGKKILVEGELNIDNYNKDGEKRSFSKVKVDKVEFLDTKSDTKTDIQRNLDSSEFEMMNDDDIPF
jgi:single-strand DNA-binding protein